MRILFVASECTPLAKVGGLGDVVGSLPKALIKAGCDVRIAIPKYRDINLKKYPFKLIAKKVKVRHGLIDIYQGFLPQTKVIVYLLANKEYFKEKGIYFERNAFVGSSKEIQRFLFFSQAVLEIFPATDWFPQIIHCHDWHTAVTILPLLIKVRDRDHSFIEGIKTLFTIHNLANQGKWRAREVLDFLGFKGDEVDSLKIRDKKGRLNILQQGILNADLLNTVSLTYRKEILTKEYGEGLEKTLLRRKKDLFGILNGIDTERFNPKTDPNIKVNYSLEGLERKQENKINLQKIFNLPQNKNIPLFCSIGRLAFQKGIDLICDVIPELVRLGCQVIILGVGKEEYERSLEALGRKYPKNVSVHIKFDSVLAQKIYAGGDLFLMPSRFEPCGLGQMIAMRYGTIPIVRKTGGLADTVKEEKTGFLFKEYKKKAFLKALKKALNFYQNKKEWQRLIKSAMKEDFSWQRSANEYKKLYKKMILSKS